MRRGIKQNKFWSQNVFCTLRRKGNMGFKKCIWIRDVFCTQHPGAGMQSASQITIVWRRFESGALVLVCGVVWCTGRCDGN